MTEIKVTDILPSRDDILSNEIENLKSSLVILQEIENLVFKCFRDGIISKEQVKTLSDFTEFTAAYKSICNEFDPKNEKKFNEMLERLKNLCNDWFDRILPCFEPILFFENKVNEIIEILKKCRESTKEGFSNNADSEINSLDYFKKQLSFNADDNEIQPFPSFPPISPYNLEEDDRYQNSFNEAMSKSQDLAEQFQEFKDLWFLLKLLSINFEIFRVDQNCPESSYIYRVQYLAGILSTMKNKE